jgi:very-short-patch-repair endonuclease
MAQVQRDGAVTDSELESVARRIFRRAGLSGWQLHAVVEGYEVDFCFATEGVIVEADGWRYHGDRRDDWERGLERDLELTALGWLVIHLTWRMMTRRPEAAIARLRASLDRRRTTLGSSSSTRGTR